MNTASYILTTSASSHFAQCTWEQESSNVYKVTFNSDFPAAHKYIRFTIPVADGANVYVTYDAEMPQEGSSDGGAVPDIELYKSTNISLNKKYSGNSIVDALGSYICAPVSIDMSKYRYLKVNGAHMSGYGGAYSTSEPVIHKIAFIKNNVITSVVYTNSIALSTDNTSKEWVIDMSKQTGYSDADAVRFMISTAGGSVELSESGIVPAANLHIVATAKIA